MGRRDGGYRGTPAGSRWAGVGREGVTATQPSEGTTLLHVGLAMNVVSKILAFVATVTLPTDRVALLLGIVPEGSSRTLCTTERSRLVTRVTAMDEKEPDPHAAASMWLAPLAATR